MVIRIEPNSAVTISRQIADQIRAQCLSGGLAPGTRMPSVRKLAHQLRTNQNTVLRVYERLAADGLLEARHGEGTFVAEKLPTHQLQGERIRFLDELNQLVLRGRLLGLDRATLQTLFEEALEKTRQS